jgi:AmiR/NasT family two-component response regulator
MERRGVSADEAFDILRRTSQALNVKLAQVAQTLVERRSGI